MAKSFWLRPLALRPCWMSLPTSNGTLSCFNSSVSRSNLAVFLVTTCCLFVPAPTAKPCIKIRIEFYENKKNSNKYCLNHKITFLGRIDLQTLTTSLKIDEKNNLKKKITFASVDEICDRRYVPRKNTHIYSIYIYTKIIKVADVVFFSLSLWLWRTHQNATLTWLTADSVFIAEAFGAFLRKTVTVSQSLDMINFFSLLFT